MFFPIKTGLDNQPFSENELQQGNRKPAVPLNTENISRGENHYENGHTLETSIKFRIQVTHKGSITKNHLYHQGTEK